MSRRDHNGYWPNLFPFTLSANKFLHQEADEPFWKKKKKKKEEQRKEQEHPTAILVQYQEIPSALMVEHHKRKVLLLGKLSQFFFHETKDSGNGDVWRKVFESDYLHRPLWIGKVVFHCHATPLVSDL